MLEDKKFIMDGLLTILGVIHYIPVFGVQKDV
jgi:hypothetical protein